MILIMDGFFYLVISAKMSHQLAFHPPSASVPSTQASSFLAWPARCTSLLSVLLLLSYRPSHCNLSAMRLKHFAIPTWVSTNRCEPSRDQGMTGSARFSCSCDVDRVFWQFQNPVSSALGCAFGSNVVFFGSLLFVPCCFFVVFGETLCLDGKDVLQGGAKKGEPRHDPLASFAGVSACARAIMGNHGTLLWLHSVALRCAEALVMMMLTGSNDVCSRGHYQSCLFFLSF